MIDERGLVLLVYCINDHISTELIEIEASVTLSFHLPWPFYIVVFGRTKGFDNIMLD